jgi:hypothetical protein
MKPRHAMRLWQMRPRQTRDKVGIDCNEAIALAAEANSSEADAETCNETRASEAEAKKTAETTCSETIAVASRSSLSEAEAKQNMP